MLVAAVAAVGLAAWGLGETLVQTDSTISDFWIIVNGMYTQVCVQAGPPQKLVRVCSK